MPNPSLLEELRQSLPGENWKTILHTLNLTGVADHEQLILASALESPPLRRLLEKMETQTLLSRHPENIRRGGKKGRPPIVYRLAEKGAEALRLLGETEAHACHLKGETPIAHALGMVDVHLAALQTGASLLTDRSLPYHKGSQALRPDHQVRLANGRGLLLEVEQSASAETLRRVMASLQRKQAFFQSPESAPYQGRVALLLQVSPADWNKTLSTWARAAHMQEEHSAKGLGFRLQVMSLSRFLASPDWEASDQSRWLELNPAKTLGVPPPQALLQHSPEEDRLLMAALWQDLLENTRQRLGEHPQPAPEFFQTLRLIYAASHAESDQPPLAQAALPHASLYLLSRYLHLRGLQQPLRIAINRGKNNTRWNPTTILHRMQTVIDCFLGLHGWRSSGPLSAYPVIPNWGEADLKSFRVEVKIRQAQILLPAGESQAPSQEALTQSEKSLAWALSALFAHSAALNLPTPEFW